jgi:hypothetical protein
MCKASKSSLAAFQACAFWQSLESYLGSSSRLSALTSSPDFQNVCFLRSTGLLVP